MRLHTLMVLLPIVRPGHLCHGGASASVLLGWALQAYSPPLLPLLIMLLPGTKEWHSAEFCQNVECQPVGPPLHVFICGTDIQY